MHMMTCQILVLGQNTRGVTVGVQDRCTVCTKRTIGSEIILVAPTVHQGDETQVEARFGLFGDSANLDTR